MSQTDSKDNTPVIEYYFSFISLWSYIGNQAFEAMAKDTGATIVYKPMDLLTVFSATDGKPVKDRAPARQAYRLQEMLRWRVLRNIDLVLHPKYYPADPSVAHRVLLAALCEGSDVKDFVQASLRAVWADELDIADHNTIIKLANDNGLDGQRLLGQTNDNDLIQQEQALTKEALERQVFGAPFYFYGEHSFWGQDRIDMLGDIIRNGGRIS